MDKILLDSTVLVDYMRGNKKAVNLINKLYRSSWFFTTVINEYELKRGAPKHTKIINELLYNLNVLPMNRAAADTAAEIYNNLKKWESLLMNLIISLQGYVYQMVLKLL